MKFLRRRKLQDLFTLSFNSALLLFAVNYNRKKVKATITSPNHQGEFAFPSHHRCANVAVGLTCARNAEGMMEYVSRKTV